MSIHPGEDATLAAERAYLARARQELGQMRERTLRLDAAQAGGAALAIEYLKSALHHRAQALIDNPETPLFFGRIDLARDDAMWHGHRFYIGRRHVHDDDGDPVVVDWRADISGAFYRATRANPMGVVLRRRFGFEQGLITAYEDEHLVDSTEARARSSILASEIERPRVGPMRDIVATIQPEQDVIVRAGVQQTICVQGAPGTGKTAVGLHRAAYLLYAHRDRLRRGGVLVVGPNNAFLSYIAQVLPALGEVEVKHVTLEELVARVPLRAEDSPDVGRLKGDERMATVLDRAVYGGLTEPVDPLVVPRGSHRWRVPAYELRQIVAELRDRDVRYGAARAMLAQRLAHAVLTKMEAAGESPDDRVQDTISRSAPVRATVDRLWPKVDPLRLVMRLLSEPEVLRAASTGILSDEEQRLVAWTQGVRGPRSAPWSLADAVLVDEAADLVERVPSLSHVVLDEAQDLSPMQLRAVGRRCSTGAATVLGDIAQGTTPWATTDWPATLRHLGKPAAHIEVLERGYRVPAKVIDFASRLLPRIAPGVAAPVAVRENPGILDVLQVARPDLRAATLRATRKALEYDGSIAVMAPDAQVSSLSDFFTQGSQAHLVLGSGASHQRVTVVPVGLAKGLEYDHVVVMEPADIIDAEPQEWLGLRRLYVVLTRAVSGLTVVHARGLPRELVETEAA